MCRVPSVSLEVRSNELALLTVLGLKRVLTVLAESCKGSCTDRESCLPARLVEMFRVPSKMRSPEVDVVRFLTVFPLSLSFRVVNSKLSGRGEMCRVPSVSLAVRSRELALLTVLGLKSVLIVLEFIWRGRVALTAVDPNWLAT